MEDRKDDFEVDISVEGKEKSSSIPTEVDGEEIKRKDKKKPVKKSKQKLEEKDEEIKGLYDTLLRAQAEFENYKKRIVKEKSDLLKYANEEIIKEMLNVVDNLEMAIKHAREADQSESITEGIEIVLKQLLKTLERFGVNGFVSVGESFDPNRHEAVVQVESAEHEPNTIMTESQKGYFLHERLLRPALVIVAKATQADAEENSD